MHEIQTAWNLFDKAFVALTSRSRICARSPTLTDAPSPRPRPSPTPATTPKPHPQDGDGSITLDELREVFIQLEVGNAPAPPETPAITGVIP